jgi:hypothetical protein
MIKVILLIILIFMLAHWKLTLIGVLGLYYFG